MPDVENLNNFFGRTIHNNVGLDHQFAGSLYLTGSAKAGKGGQLFNAVDNRMRDPLADGGIVLLDAYNSGFKLVGGFGRPPNEPHD
jgi:hypothetical protein